MYDMIDTPASPSPASFKARAAQIERQLLEQHGPLHVPDPKGGEFYFSREHAAIIARRVEAERRARNESRYEGALRTLLAQLEAAATRRGRTIEKKGYSDEQCPSLDAMCAANGVVRLVRSMCVRLAELETTARMTGAHYEITARGTAALAEASQEMAS